MDESGQYEIADKWHAHDFEPWCATWDNWDLNTVWSGESSCDLCGCVVLRVGGDDLKLKRWDVRDTSAPTSVNKR